MAVGLGEGFARLDVIKRMRGRSRVCAWLLLPVSLACSGRQSAPADPAFVLPKVELTKGSAELRLAPASSPGGGSVAPVQSLAQAYAQTLARAPADYSSLEASLGKKARPHGAPFDPRQARFYDVVVGRLSLNEAQIQQLVANGAISLALDDKATMGRIYAALWMADLPVFITTDSILHAWHKTYDATLASLEVTKFTHAYAALLEGVAARMKTPHVTATPKLQAAAKKLDLYISVARTLLPPVKQDFFSPGQDIDGGPPDSVEPLLAEKKDVETIVQAAYEQQPRSVPGFGEVDFSQFKPRGHYTDSEGLRRYFRALMWMGRADTGFELSNPESTRIALLLALLADQSGKVGDFAHAQRMIDYFVGTSNGLSLTDVVAIVRKHKVTFAQLEDDARVASLAELLRAAAPSNRVTSEVVMSDRTPTPPPVVFQLSSQRFTLDGFVHEQVSHDRVDRRTMVDGLDVFAAMGNAEATRLLRPQLEAFGYSAQMFALQRTIAALPATYWQQSIYTRWFDALRSLHSLPDGAFVPEFFGTEVWQHKQLVNQLASWAELRRDTILYTAQVYATATCDFPDVYLEPYPAFFDRIHDMALDAQRRVGDKQLFASFVDLTAMLSDVATRQITQPERNHQDQEFLKSLVKLRYLGSGCAGPETEWTGWYRSLYPGGEMFDFEPVIADVFTDPNSGGVLNVATTGPELMVAAIKTQDGPTLFVGPVSSYRQFVGQRMSDQEWQEQVTAGKAPAPPQWNTLQAGMGTLPPKHD